MYIFKCTFDLQFTYNLHCSLSHNLKYNFFARAVPGNPMGTRSLPKEVANALVVKNPKFVWRRHVDYSKKNV